MDRLDLALTWLKTARAKLNNSQESTDIKTKFYIQIQENMAYVLQVLGELDNATEHIDDVLNMEPNHYLKLTKKYFSKLPEESEKYTTFKESDHHSNYARLCRGENSDSSGQTNKLNCYLDSSAHPYFILSPLQIEPVLTNPPITLYHKLLNDEQIEQLVSTTNATLERSQVARAPGVNEVAEIRVSQQIWVDPTESKTATFMYRMVSLIAGFNMKNAEKMQVANYGIGGQYIPHYDFFVVGLKCFVLISKLSCVLIPFFYREIQNLKGYMEIELLQICFM